MLDAWVSPHAHRGAGIRKLGLDLFECRAGVRLRLLFQPDPIKRELVFFEVGNHDEIRRALKNNLKQFLLQVQIRFEVRNFVNLEPFCGQSKAVERPESRVEQENSLEEAQKNAKN